MTTIRSWCQLPPASHDKHHGDPRPGREPGQGVRRSRHVRPPGGPAAVFATQPNTAEDEVDNLVEARLARQVILTRDDPPPPLLWALIDESVLYRPVTPGCSGPS